jgi:chromate reductase, NAD(P)H dehydrogenase (quinone)
MSSTVPTVALLPGSIRASSLHRRLAAAVEDGLRQRHIDVDLIDLGDHPMPIYHGDDEAELGPPSQATALHDRIAACDGLILVSPEYNGGPSPLLKNAIDWVTRVDRGTLRRPLVGLVATSPGSRGGIHGLGVLRSIAVHMRLAIVDADFSLPEGHQRLEPVGGSWRVALDADAERFGQWLDVYVERLGEHRAARVAVDEGGTGR